MSGVVRARARAHVFVRPLARRILDVFRISTAALVAINAHDSSFSVCATMCDTRHALLFTSPSCAPRDETERERERGESRVSDKSRADSFDFVIASRYHEISRANIDTSQRDYARARANLRPR